MSCCLNYYLRTILATLAVSLIIISQAISQTITEWPEQDRINTKAFESRFIELFSSEPDHLPDIVSNLVTCELSESRARQISNTTKDVMESVYSKSPNVTVDINIDIKKLLISSSAKGCQLLKSVVLRTVNYGAMKQYLPPKSFPEPIRVDAEYYYNSEMTMDIGGKEHKTNTNINQSAQWIYHSPVKPVNPAYTSEIIAYSRADSMDAPVYSAKFIHVNDNTELTEVILTRMKILENTNNSLSLIGKTSSGLPIHRHYGKNMIFTQLNGKQHGLMTTENYLYRTDKSAAPLSYTCYDMGKKINVFKIKSTDDCLAVAEEKMNDPDVHVDAIYKIQLDNKIAQAKLQSILTSKSEQENPILNKQNKKIALENANKEKFNTLVKKSKCKLSNNKWVYTGNSCKKGYANGKGTAEDVTGLKFVGTFKNGNRTKGEIHQDGEMIFSGDLVDDKPNGSAICLHEGEYEECRFFKGKRIDTLYKIRIENAKLQAKMKSIEDKQRLQQASGTPSNDSSNMMVDALKREGTKRAASFIFDQLF